MKTKKNITEWLRDHPLIKHSALEREAGIRQGMIRDALAGSRELTSAHREKLAEALREYGY